MEAQQQYTSQNKFSLISLFIGVASLVGLVIINVEIANAYQKASGKTKLWFWITEMTFNYKYYLLLPVFIAIVLGVASTKRKESKKISFAAIILSLSVFACIFFKIWRLMV